MSKVIRVLLVVGLCIQKVAIAITHPGYTRLMALQIPLTKASVSSGREKNAICIAPMYRFFYRTVRRGLALNAWASPGL